MADVTSPPVRLPHLERALEKLTGTTCKVEIHDNLGIVISRLPMEDPIVTAGRIEDRLLEILK
jgi:hypothetical protein